MKSFKCDSFKFYQYPSYFGVAEAEADAADEMSPEEIEEEYNDLGTLPTAINRDKTASNKRRLEAE